MTNEFDKYWEKVIYQNDLKAFEWIYKNAFRFLCFYAHRITENQFLAEEAVQEVFIKIWNEKDKIQIKFNIKSYLYQMVYNTAVNKLVHAKTLKNKVNRTGSPELWQKLNESFGYSDYILEKLEACDLETVIHTVIEKLPEQCREVFKLSRFENLTNDEIAEKQNISVNTVRTHIYRALEKLKEALDKIS